MAKYISIAFLENSIESSILWEDGTIKYHTCSVDILTQYLDYKKRPLNVKFQTEFYNSFIESLSKTISVTEGLSDDYIVKVISFSSAILRQFNSLIDINFNVTHKVISPTSAMCNSVSYKDKKDMKVLFIHAEDDSFEFSIFELGEGVQEALSKNNVSSNSNYDVIDRFILESILAIDKNIIGELEQIVFYGVKNENNIKLLKYFATKFKCTNVIHNHENSPITLGLSIQSGVYSGLFEDHLLLDSIPYNYDLCNDETSTCEIIRKANFSVSKNTLYSACKPNLKELCVNINKWDSSFKCIIPIKIGNLNITEEYIELGFDFSTTGIMNIYINDKIVEYQIALDDGNNEPTKGVKFMTHAEFVKLETRQ